MPRKVANIKYSMGRFVGLFVGSAGSGKSLAAMTFPKPIYLFDIDGRVKSIRNFYSEQPEILNGIEYESYINFDRMVDKLEQFTMDNFGIGTIVIDSLTTLGALTLRAGRQSRGGKLFSFAGTEKPRGDRRLAGISIPTMEDYLLEASLMRDIIYSASKVYKCNIILTAHLVPETGEVYDDDDDSSKKKKDEPVEHTTYVLFTGGKKIAPIIPAEFDEVYKFYQSKDRKFNVSTRPNKSVPFLKTSLKLPEKFPIHMNPLKPINASNGALYPLLVRYCKEKGFEVPEL